MAGKKLNFISRYWGDIAWFLILPFHIYFYYLNITHEIDPDPYHTGVGEKMPLVNPQFSLALFCVYLAYTIFSAYRILFRKKYLLRDFHYLIIGILATRCFVWLVFVGSPYLSQSDFFSHVKVLQQINLVFLNSRVAIWLYNWWQEPGPTEENLAPDDAQQTDGKDHAHDPT